MSDIYCGNRFTLVHRPPLISCSVGDPTGTCTKQDRSRHQMLLIFPGWCTQTTFSSPRAKDLLTSGHALLPLMRAQACCEGASTSRWKCSFEACEASKNSLCEHVTDVGLPCRSPIEFNYHETSALVGLCYPPSNFRRNITYSLWFNYKVQDNVLGSEHMHCGWRSKLIEPLSGSCPEKRVTA